MFDETIHAPLDSLVALDVEKYPMASSIELGKLIAGMLAAFILIWLLVCLKRLGDAARSNTPPHRRPMLVSAHSHTPTLLVHAVCRYCCMCFRAKDALLAADAPRSDGPTMHL